MTTHKLKTWPEHFDAIVSGKKKFEVRRNDRGFQVGDTLMLVPYCPKLEKVIGPPLYVIVDHILKGGDFGLHDEHVAMSISPIDGRA